MCVLSTVPALPLTGIIYQDFDGGLVGQTVSEALTSNQFQGFSKVTWEVVPASRFSGGPDELANAIRHEDAWTAVSSACLSPHRTAFCHSPSASFLSQPRVQRQAECRANVARSFVRWFTSDHWIRSRSAERERLVSVLAYAVNACKLTFCFLQPRPHSPVNSG